jgi:hypothetical protein
MPGEHKAKWALEEDKEFRKLVTATKPSSSSTGTRYQRTGRKT